MAYLDLAFENGNEMVVFRLRTFGDHG